MHKIRVKINKKGEAKIKVEGCAGPSCKALTKDLEKALGDTTSDTNTLEYNQAAQTQAQQQKQGS